MGHRWLAALFLGGFAGLGTLASCGGAPENPGDACDPGGDPCPAGLSCGKDADGDQVCLIDPGGTCDPKADPTYCASGTVCDTDAAGTSACRITEGGTCDPTLDDPHCAKDLVCANLVAGGAACYPPVVVRGKVFDAGTQAGIGSAQVLALDDKSSAMTDVAVSAPDGAYALDLPVPRDADGKPTNIIFTLRAAAKNYEPFPSGIRTALPVTTSGAMKGEAEWVVQLPLTDIALIPLAAADQGHASIAGHVAADDRSGGVLVVAEGASGKGISAVSDKSGAYTIFNVPDGAYTMHGYAAGVQLDTPMANVAGADLMGIDLHASDAALGSVSGSIQIVDGGGASATSVVLVPESTFDDTFVRGEVPRGLRAPPDGPPNVTGAFTIENVPAGKYVVLAAFENDGLVRDPDPNIAGTQIAHVDMPSPGMAVPISTSFKVTGALAVLSPGAGDVPDGVSGNPTFKWADDSSEKYYTIELYDAYGNLTWQNPMVPSVSGGEVSVAYDGPALQKGMYYQFRATSWRTPGGTPGPISQTEDLRGVFYAQ